MELLVYTRIEREKFQKEHFLCENDILLCVLSGAFKVKTDGKWITVEENQAFLFLKGKPYERRILRPMTMALFRYESATPLFGSEHIVFKDAQRFRSTLFLAEKCEHAQDCRARRASLLCDMALQHAIESEMVAEDRAEDAEMIRAERRMKSRLQESFSISEIAKDCALSHVQFIRRFRAAFGHTPMEHITFLRLELAKELLAQTTFPIKEIAKKCGFESEYYFSNFFKKHTLLAPSNYRAIIP